MSRTLFQFLSEEAGDKYGFDVRIEWGEPHWWAGKIYSPAVYREELEHEVDTDRQVAGTEAQEGEEE